MIFTPVLLRAWLAVIPAAVYFLAVVVIVVLIAARVQIFRKWELFRLKRLHLSCPNSGCYEPIHVPVYVCYCGEEQDDLLPSDKGMFRHTCPKCAASLPTHGKGRRQLPSKCPHCRKSMTLVKNPVVRVPLVAGPSTGKTSYMMGCLAALHDQQAAGRLAVSLPDPAQEKFYEAAQELFQHGHTMLKTAEMAPDAVVVQLKDNLDHSLVIHTYDVAGELYEQPDAMRSQQYFGGCNGLLFLVDPFSLPAVRSEYADSLAESEDQVRPSHTQPQEVYERLIAIMREQGREKDLADIPIAVVVTKADAFGLSRDLHTASLHTPGSMRVARDAELVRDWLRKHGQGNLVRGIEKDFRNVNYFACSALGRLPDESDRAFEPQGVIHPLAWLMAFHGLELEEAVCKLARRSRVLAAAKITAIAVAILLATVVGDASLFRVLSPSALRWVAEADKADHVSRLIRFGAPVNAPDGTGDTALILASRAGASGTVGTLLQAGADTGWTNQNGQTALLAAAAAGKAASLEVLLGFDPSPVLKGGSGEGALALAVQGGFTDACKVLLIHRADPNGVPDEGKPLLAVAAASNLTEIGDLLLTYHADPNCSDLEGKPLLGALLAQGSFAWADKLVRHGANVNRLAADGRTPLALVVDQKQQDMAKLLLDHGAKPDYVPDGKAAPLVLAVAKHDAPMVRLLLKYEASPDQTAGTSTYPIIAAVNEKQADIVSALVDSGADLGKTDGQGNTPLMLAIKTGAEDLFGQLLAKSPVNGANSSGNTPLTLALSSKKEGMAQRLINAGASPNQQGADGDPPLVMALRNGDSSSARLLLNAGANWQASAKNGESVLTLAHRYDSTIAGIIEARIEAAKPKPKPTLAPIEDRAEAARPQPNPPPAAEAESPVQTYSILAGSFSSRSEAGEAQRNLSANGLSGYVVSADGVLWVKIGGFRSQARAASAANQAAMLGYAASVQ